MRKDESQTSTQDETIDRAREYFQVRKAICKMKKHKAAGPDNIPNEALKLGIKVPPLCDLFNLVLKKGSSPPAWAEGIMHLVYKGKGDPTDLRNSRGLTVNNSVSKVFTSLLNQRLNV